MQITGLVRCIGMVWGLWLGVGYEFFRWEDKWHGEEPLKMSFLRLYSILNQKYFLIKDVMEVLGGRVVWALTFRRNLMDYEVAHLQVLLSSLTQASPSIDWVDKRLWKGAKWDLFMQSLYYLLVSDLPTSFLFKPFGNILPLQKSRVMVGRLS